MSSEYGAVSRQEQDNALSTSRQADANLDAARKTEQVAIDGLRGAEARVGEARARLASANAALLGIRALREKGLSVRPLQEYHAELRDS